MIEIFTNKILISAALACLVPQLIKFITEIFSNKKLDFFKLLETGGMPSAHAAVVSTVTTSVYLDQGATPLFAVILIVSIIFIRDALGVRRTVHEQSKILRKISPEAYKLKKEGHKFLEVFIGIIIGIIVSMIIY